jgi:hypothetical protein
VNAPVAGPPPYGLEATFERAVACLAAQSDVFWHKVGYAIDPTKIADEPSRYVLEACRRSVTKNHAVDPILTLQELRDEWNHKAFSIDLYAQAVDIIDDALEHKHIGGLERYGNKLAPYLQEAAKMRLAEKLHGSILRREPLGPLVNEIQSIDAIGTTAARRAPSLEEMTERLRNYEPRQRIPTGIEDLDIVIEGGIPKSELSIFLGPTGAGKTAMLIQLAVEANMLGLDVAYATLEIPELQVFCRYLSNLTNLAYLDIMNNFQIRELAISRLQEINDLYTLGAFRIKSFTPNATTAEAIFRWADQEEQDSGRPISMLDIDYINLLGSPLGKDHPGEQQKRSAVSLQGHAHDTGRWVASAGQVTREALNSAKVSKLDLQHAGGSKGIVENAGLVVTMNPRQNREALAYYLAKARDLAIGATVGPILHNLAHSRMSYMERGFAWG